MADGLLIDVLTPNDPRLKEVVRLADAAKATLGFLPHDVYRAAAAAGTLIVAVRAGDVAGYALFACMHSVIP